MAAVATPELIVLEQGADQRSIREHLAQVVNSPQFAAAPKLARFLTFVVEMTLAGDGDQIKESLVAVEVYGRRPDYNPQIDSTVRVEAGRLRARLKQYYEAHGSERPVYIELPKGTYVPVFHSRPASSKVMPSPRPQSRRHRFAALAAAGAVAVACGAGFYMRPLAAHAAPDPDVMHAFLRAEELLRLPVLKDGAVKVVPPSVYESVRLFEEVTRRAPRFARGWVGLAEANEWLYEIDRSHPPERLIAAKAAAHRAIQLDRDLPEAWTILTSILFFREWDIPAAEVACRRAIELNPRDVLAQRRLVDLLRIQGRVTEAGEGVARALRHQPSAPDLRNRRALLLLEQGRLEEAIREARTAESLNPSGQQTAFTMSLWIQAVSHQLQGRVQEAEALYRRALAHQPHDRWSEPALAHLLASTGRREEALQILSELERQLSLGRPHYKSLALVHVALGQPEHALEWLDRGYAARDADVLFIASDPRFEPVRNHPRFLSLLARIRRTSAPPRLAA